MRNNWIKDECSRKVFQEQVKEHAQGNAKDAVTWKGKTPGDLHEVEEQVEGTRSFLTSLVCK